MEFTLAQAVFAIIGANLVMLLSSIGITITLFIHMDNKSQKMLGAISDEMKDFHGKLCAIEERERLEGAK